MERHKDEMHSVPLIFIEIYSIIIQLLFNYI